MIRSALCYFGNAGDRHKAFFSVIRILKAGAVDLVIQLAEESE
jgi:hypothetical protein